MPKNIKKVIFHPAVFIPLLLVIFLVTALLGRFLVWPGVKKHQAQTYKKEALGLIESENYRNAFLKIQRAILKNPEDIESYKIALTAVENSPEHFQYVPAYLNKLTEMDPENPGHFLKYILFMIRIGDLDEAQSTFENYPNSSKDTDEYLQLGYSLSLGLNDLELAEHYLEELLKSNPGDQKLLYSLSTLRLQKSKDPTKVLHAKETLTELSSIDSSRIPALRVLLTHALLENNLELVADYIGQLKKTDALSIPDQLLTLHASKAIDESTFERNVSRFLESDISIAENQAATLDFLIQNQLYSIASTWVDSLPKDDLQPKVLKKQVAQLYFLTEDWSKLIEFITEDNWGDDEFGRLLLMAYANKARDDLLEFKKWWQECLIKAGNNRGYLRVILETATTWKWKEESLEVLEVLFRNDPSDDDTYNALLEHFMTEGDTDKTLKLLERRVQRMPDDKESKNNFALLSLLSSSNNSRAFQFAKENYLEDSRNPYFITTWAYALQAQGRVDEATTIINTLAPNELNDSRRAIYIAKVYYAAGWMSEAREIMQNTDEEGLFQEERSLLRSLRSFLMVPAE